jgi:hypothetical protein
VSAPEPLFDYPTQTEQGHDVRDYSADIPIYLGSTFNIRGAPHSDFLHFIESVVEITQPG